jgi:hypothetical protein
VSAWWNPSWTKRMNVTINNSQNLDTLTDYQVFLNMSYKSEMQYNFDDLRFTYNNPTNNSELPVSYWIENYTTLGYADIWIKVSTIRGNSYETIYMYYGNPNVSTESNATSTFVIWDDFNKGNLSNWNYSYFKSDNNCEGPVLVNLSIINFSLFVSYSVECPCKGVVIYVYPYFSQNITDLRYSLKYNFGEDPNNNGAENGGIVYRANSSFCGYTAYQNTWSGSPEQMRIDACGVGIISSKVYQSLLGNKFYSLYGIAVKDFHNFTIDNMSTFGNDNTYSTGLFTIYVHQYNGYCDYSGWVEIDDIRVQKYTRPEPTYLIPLEETYSLKQKILFISDTNWKNILSVAPVKKPTIITNTIDTDILHFINTYNPEQIFLLGNITGEIPNFETHKISYTDVPQLFFNTSKGMYTGEDKQKVTSVSLLASLLNKPIVFNPNNALPEYNFSNNSTEEIENLYLQKVKEQNKNINYLEKPFPN